METEQIAGVLLMNHGPPGTNPFSLVAVLLLVINIVATVSVVRGRLALLAKILWLLAIWLLPLIGAILYALLGRTARG